MMRYAIGSYTSMGGPGIALVTMEHGKLKLVGSAAGEVQNPIWIEQNPKQDSLLYAACSTDENESGLVASLLLEGDSLRLRSIQPTGGIACCHLAISEDGDCLFAANYVDGLVTAHPISQDGSIQPASQHLQLKGEGPNPERQERAHAHQIVFRPESDQVFVCDLGSDSVWIYQRDEKGRLTLIHQLRCSAGIGPRHLSFDGPDRFYLVGELGGWIAHYQLEENEWRLRQLMPTLPETDQPGNTAAAIRVEGSKVYVSNRGYDSIAVFDRDEAGMLTEERQVKLPGRFPRDFMPVPGGFLVACQNSGELLLTDREGKLLQTLPIPGAVSILPLKSCTYV